MAEPIPTFTYSAQPYVHEADGQFFPAVITDWNNTFQRNYVIEQPCATYDQAMQLAKLAAQFELQRFRAAYVRFREHWEYGSN